MATYEYVCLSCEHLFEERSPMSEAPVETVLACPSCGSERVRRRFSFSAATRGTGRAPSVGSGCGCGSCTCGAG